MLYYNRSSKYPNNVSFFVANYDNRMGEQNTYLVFGLSLITDKPRNRHV